MGRDSAGLHKALVDQADERGRHPGKIGGIGVEMLLAKVVPPRARERPAAHEHLPGHHSQGVDVRGTPCRLEPPTFGSSVRRRHGELPGILRG